MNRPALFLDRDGVVTDLVYYPSHGEWEAPRTVADLRFRPGVFDALRRVNASGWPLFLITNQPSFAKGKCPLEGLQEVQGEVMRILGTEGIEVMEAFVCYHHPESTIPGHGACECRKPSPRSLLGAAARHGLDLSSSWMAGDQDTDVQTGRNAGCRTALVEYEHSADKRGASIPDLYCSDVTDLVQRIL